MKCFIGEKKIDMMGPLLDNYNWGNIPCTLLLSVHHEAIFNIIMEIY